GARLVPARAWRYHLGARRGPSTAGGPDRNPPGRDRGTDRIRRDRAPGGRRAMRRALNAQISVGNSSFPRKRESRTPRIHQSPPVHARGRLWTPAFAGATGNTSIIYTLFRAGLLGLFLLGFGVVGAAAGQPQQGKILYYRDPM